MKKLILFGIFSLWLLAGAFADKRISEVTLENGMPVFFLQDTSTPLVKIEFTCRAGFSSQIATTAGFFKLYSRIFKASVPQINFDEVQCNADSSRYILTVPASHVEKVLNYLSKAAFSPDFSDELVEENLNSMKREVLAAVETPSVLLNGAIDSRVFSASPWKHDSGIYPALFGNHTTETARTILNKISESWYTPKNSGLFICGNFNQDQLLQIIKETFGSYYSNFQIPVEKPSMPMNKNRKFVFHSDDFSSDIVQMVMQYTMLDWEECDLGAEILNQDFSSFKNQILKNSELGIPGGEYINVAAAHKRDSSRLIIQSILQKQEMVRNKNGKKVPSSFDQAQLFQQQIETAITQTTPEEFINGKQQLSFKLNSLNTNSFALMNRLSEFWALRPYQKFYEEGFDFESTSLLAAEMHSKNHLLQQLEMEKLFSQLEAEQPYVFVLINSSDYKKNKAAYDKAGYEEINSKNASWYNQKLYENLSLEKAEKSQKIKQLQILNSYDDNNYYLKNKNTIKIEALDNGIQVVSKFNDRNSEISILISINGGRLKSANKDGLEEVLLNLLCQNIQKEIYRQQLQGMILGIPEVSYNCQLNSGYILIDCDKSDFSSCCKAISNALIYEEFPPAAADWAVASTQYNRRIENGRTVNQLYGAIIKQLYSDSPIERIYNTQNEILTQVDYLSILENYPQLLDASRYSIIVTGNFDKNYLDTMNKTLGLLARQGTKIKTYEFHGEFSENKEIQVYLAHKFYADPTLDKNAPMPAILIPTYDFYDPGIFVLKAPEKDTPERIYFQSVLMYLETLSSEENPFSVILPDSQKDFGAIIFSRLKNRRVAEEIYKNIIDNLYDRFRQEKIQQTVEKIKDNWVSKEMANAISNSGTAILLQQGFEAYPYNPEPFLYLQNYNSIQKAEIQDFEKILQYFPETPALKAYSADTK